MFYMSTRLTGGLPVSRNWSNGRKILLMVLMQFLTFSVYIGSAIYTPSIPGIMEEFGVGYTKATLGLSLYVLAYGLGVSRQSSNYLYGIPVLMSMILLYSQWSSVLFLRSQASVA